MKIQNLVLGGAGYTGTVLVRDLLKLNQKVTVIDNFMYDKNALNTLKKNTNLNIINSNILKYKNLKKILNNFDYIYPLSGIVGDPACAVDKKLTRSYNIDSIKLILDCFKENKSKIIYPSSCSVYGLVEKAACEKTSLNPQSYYAETKIECENLLKFLDKKNVIILRLPTIFGFSLRNRFDLVVNKMTLDLCTKGIIKVFNPNSSRPLLSVNDLSQIYINSQKINNQFKTYNIGSELHNFTLENIARKIVRSLSNEIANPKIEFQDLINDKRSYSIILDRFKSYNYNSFLSIEFEVKKIFQFLKLKKTNSFNISKKYNNIIS